MIRPINVNYFAHIPIDINKSLLLTRLGYQKGVTITHEKDNLFIDEAIKEALLLCHIQGAFGQSKIIEHTANKLVLENNTELISEKLAFFLRKSSAVVFMSATAGREICHQITATMQTGNAALAIVFDAVASQAVDLALDWLMAFINKATQISGRVLTKRRFSPGYGDLALFYQKTIYDLLDLKQMDLTITQKFMLEPEKSVIAIAGIEETLWTK